MVIRLFKESHPATFIIVPVFILIFLVISWHGPGEYVVQNPMPLYDLVLGFVNSIPELLTGFFVLAILVSQVFHLNFIIGKHEVLYRNSYLPALLFTVLLVMIPQFMTFHPVLLVNSLLIFVFDKLFKIYKNPSPLPMMFDACFLIGIATLIYLPAISFFLLFAASVLILKTFSWRDWTIGFIGFCLPFFFAFVYYFWIDGLDTLKEKFFLNNISRLINPEGFALRGYTITLVVISLITILTLLRISQNFYKNTTRIRNFQQVIFISMVVGMLSLAVTGSVAIYRFSILTIPLSTMISYYFLSGKKAWWNEVLFWILIATVIVNYTVGWYGE